MSNNVRILIAVLGAAALAALATPELSVQLPAGVAQALAAAIAAALHKVNAKAPECDHDDQCNHKEAL
jgi:hypothetical protein